VWIVEYCRGRRYFWPKHDTEPIFQPRADIQLGVLGDVGGLLHNAVQRLPPDGAILFYNESLYDYNFTQISNPAWTFDDTGTENTYNLSPQCNYGVNGSANSATLSYGLTPPYITLQQNCKIVNGKLECVPASPPNLYMTDATSSASIYYTLDGTTPTTSSALYTGPLDYSASAQYQAIAVLGSLQSTVAVGLAPEIK
jgi:hypothetical protein